MRLMTIVLGTCCAASAAAADVPPPRREPLIEQALPPGGHTHFVKATLVTFAPGQPTPRHRHPAPVFGVVTEGGFVFQIADQPAHILKKGDTFYEPPGVTIDRFDNADGTTPAAITAFYLLDRPDQPTIEMLGR